MRILAQHLAAVDLPAFPGGALGVDAYVCARFAEVRRGIIWSSEKSPLNNDDE